MLLLLLALLEVFVPWSLTLVNLQPGRAGVTRTASTARLLLRKFGVTPLLLDSRDLVGSFGDGLTPGALLLAGGHHELFNLSNLGGLMICSGSIPPYVGNGIGVQH